MFRWMFENAWNITRKNCLQVSKLPKLEVTHSMKNMMKQFGFWVISVHPWLVASDYGVHEIWVTVYWNPAYPVSPWCSGMTLSLSLQWKSDEGCNITSLKCCLSSTDIIDRREKSSCLHMKVQGCIMQVRFYEIHQVFRGRKRSDIFLTE